MNLLYNTLLLDNQTTAVQDRLELIAAKLDRVEKATQRLNTLYAKDDLLDAEDDYDNLDEQLEESPHDRLFDKHDTVGDPLSQVHYFGAEQFKVKAKDLFKKHKPILQSDLGREPARIAPFELKLKDNSDWYTAKAHKLAPRLQSEKKLKATREFVNKALAQGLIEPSQSESWSQILLTPKPNGSWRFCVDYRHLNQNTTALGWPLPNIRQMLEHIGSKKPKRFAVLDLTQGYYQAAISKNSRPLTAFRTADGLYQWTRLPMGLKGAPSFFQHAMQHGILSDFLYKFCQVYLDDIIVYADTDDELLENLEKILVRLESFNITLNPAKVKVGLDKVEYVGHTVDAEGLHFSDNKREEVWNVPVPQTQKQLKSFLGLCVQFKDHVHRYSDIVAPLHGMLANYTKASGHLALKWTTETLERFQELKKAVNECPKLFYIDSNAPVFLHTDASNYGIGGYLFQVIDGKNVPIMFLSKTLTKQERRWSTYEKEGYSIFWCLMKMEHLLRDIHFTLRTDHKNLTFINTDFREKVKRWKMHIQHYDFHVEHIKGEHNIEADGFSRLIPVPESEEQESLFALREEERLTPLLPRKIYEMIKEVHNPIIGHFGVEKTMQKLTLSGKEWVGMRNDISKFIKRCPCCQKMSFLKDKIVTQPFTLASYSPFDRICVDTRGPLPEDVTTGNKYILTITDAFSRFVQLYPMRDASAEAAIPGLLSYIGLFGIPSEVVKDNGTQFANQLVTQLLDILQTDNVKIQAYSKEENGIVERANKEVNRHLRAIVFNRKIKTKWSLYLPLVQRIMNASVHSTIGVTPAQIVFGNAVNLDRNLIPLVRAPPNKTTQYVKYIEDLADAQLEIVKIAVRNQLDTDQFHVAQRGGKGTITEFPINSYVLVNYEATGHKPPTKLHTYLRGPLRVVNSVGPIYTLQNLVTNQLEDFHVKLLHAFNYDEASVDPAEVAQHDQDYFGIKEVLGHRYRGKKKRRSDLSFNILWDGEKEPVWTDWNADLGANETIHEYLAANKLKRHIPPKYTWPKGYVPPDEEGDDSD
jgi:hypothetical protein